MSEGGKDTKEQKEDHKPQKVEGHMLENGIPCFYARNLCRDGMCGSIAMVMAWAMAKNASPKKRAMCLACCERKTSDGFTVMYADDDYDVDDDRDMKVLA